MLKVPFSVKRAAELNQNMYQITITLPESKKAKDILLKMDHEQVLLMEIIKKSFLGAALRKTGTMS